MDDKNYILIQGWMINKLHLTGNELLIYAIIYGFSQDGESFFEGSARYIYESLKISRTTAMQTLKSLVERNLIIKQEKDVNNVKLANYKVNLDMLQIEQGVQKLYRGCTEIVQGGCTEIVHHNTNIDNTRDNNIYSNKQESISKNEKVATEQPIGEQVAKPQKSSFERLTEWYCRHFVAGSEERKKQFLKDFGFFFYDLLDRCNDSVRLAGCVIKICKERYKCDLEGILSNFDNVLADAMIQAFGANPVIDTKKLEKDINKPRRKKTTLQIFSNFVLSKYEANGNNFTENQKSVWFKRNCKSMSDILKFCENDIELALECVKVCAERLEKAGFEGGLDAVARNINTYYLEAKKRLKRS